VDIQWRDRNLLISVKSRFSTAITAIAVETRLRVNQSLKGLEGHKVE